MLINVTCSSHKGDYFHIWIICISGKFRLVINNPVHATQFLNFYFVKTQINMVCLFTISVALGLLQYTVGATDLLEIDPKTIESTKDGAL
jgi:hypothetical protein